MGKLIAKKENGKIKIPKEYKFCIAEPSEKEIEEIFKKTIDDDYIRDALIHGHIKEEDSGFLEKWKGRTVHFALEKHTPLYYAVLKKNEKAVQCLLDHKTDRLLLDQNSQEKLNQIIHKKGDKDHDI